MIPQILMNVMQTGGKFFFDLDPTLTEHIVRHSALQVMMIAQNSMSAAMVFGDKCAASLAPMWDGLRSVKWHWSQT